MVSNADLPVCLSLLNAEIKGIHYHTQLAILFHFKDSQTHLEAFDKQIFFFKNTPTKFSDCLRAHPNRRLASDPESIEAYIQITF